MIQAIKSFLRQIPGIQQAWSVISCLKETWAYIAWSWRGKPPGDVYSFYKRYHLIREGKRYDCSTLVETGTYLGKTVQAARRHFQQVLSVELSPIFYQKASRKFRNAPNVMLWQGDSGQLMSAMIRHITGRAIFWLDGHYCGGITARGATDCPIITELTAIGQHERKDHLILIDDARCFGKLPDYPTQQKIQQLLLEINPQYHITVEDDCIVARPKQTHALNKNIERKYSEASTLAACQHDAL